MNEIEKMAKDICEYNRMGICELDDKRCDLICTKGAFFKRVYNAGYRKQSGWITVAERMPDPNEYDWVLVAAIFNEDGTYGVPMVAEFRRGTWYSLGDNDITVEDRFMTVTHWMPLPKPPKGE